MKGRDLVHRNSCAGTLLAAIVFALPALVGRDAFAGEGERPVLTVQETVGAAFHYDLRKRGPRPWHIYARANPKARELLHRILADRRSRMHHAAAVYMLGFVGKDEDATKLLKYFEKFSGVLEIDQRYAASAFFCSLGVMSRRGVMKADELAAKLAAPAYWKTSKLKWHAKPKTIVPFEQESAAKVISGYSLCGDEKKIGKLVSALLEVVKDQSIKKYLGGSRLPPASLARSGKDALARERLPIADKDREDLRALCKRNFGALEGEKSDLTAEDLEFLKRTRAEALKEYARFRKLVLDGKVDELREQVLDNGRRIDERKLKTIWPEYKRGFESQKKLLEELEKVTCKPANFRIERKAVYREVPSARAGKAREMVKDEFLLVTFELEGTAEFGRKHFKHIADWRMFRPDRTLKVLLRKESDKWYWNPFGW